MTTTIDTRTAAGTALQEVLPRVWRWAHPGASDRCGTALSTGDGLVLVDPPALSAEDRTRLEAEVGPVKHVLLTSARHAALAGPYRGSEVTVWAPRAAAGCNDAPEIDHLFGYEDHLPGGILPLQLPEAAAPDEVAYLWPPAGDGLLIAGDVLPVVGQTPVYREGDAPPMDAYLDAVKALLVAEPGTLAPAHQAPPEEQVIYATAWAAHIGSMTHRRRAAPVTGPRLLVAQAARALQETLTAPVVLRLPAVVADDPPAAAAEKSEERVAPETWVADPFACARCGRPHEPMRQTCGGPMIARLCPDCRTERRQELPEARLMVCAGGCCTREGARAVLSAARQAATNSDVADVLDVVPVSCLGECSLGPFVRLSTSRGEEIPQAEAYRTRTVERARRFAEDEGEIIDDESELVLSRFAALAQPAEVARLVSDVADTLKQKRDL